MLTEAQIAWVTEFLAIEPSDVTEQPAGNGTSRDGRPDSDTADGDLSLTLSVSPETDAGAPAEGLRDGTTQDGSTVGALPSLPSLPSIPDLPDPGVKVHITIDNRSGHQLDLVRAILENPKGSEFETPPPGSIDGDKDTATIVVSNNFPFLTGVGGSAVYRLADEPGTTVTFKWERGRVPRRKATMTINPDDPKRFSKDQGFDGDNFTFTLRSKDKKPDGPSGGVALNCRVTVVNQTSQTVFLRKQDNSAGGDFVTNPLTSLAPGGSTNFIYGETPGTNDHRCRGTMSWDIGDPKLGSWSMMWDNQKGAKNLSASFLAPDDGSFHTLDQIDQGDENVPVIFTLTGGTAPKPAAGTRCAITVVNQTQVALNQITVLTNSGAFQQQPPAKIDAGGSARFLFTSPPDDPSKEANGGVQWSIGDTNSIAWQTTWRKPPNGSTTVDNKVAPDGSGFNGTATVSDANDGTAEIAFTITGGGQPQPEPDDEFAPPPKTKQPTLRIRDKSPDGWVEYAQRLLNKWSISKGLPKDPVNGDFNAAMQKKVKAFQADQQCQPDGVIGNETWSMLREGPKEKVGTDGRKPHSFEQKDAQGRFVTEKPDSTGYSKADDSYFMRIVSVGEKPIDAFDVEVKVTQPDGTSHAHHFKIGAAVSPSDDGQGNFHLLVINGFSRAFGLAKNPRAPVDPLTCSVDAYLPKEIGGDRWTGPVVAAP